MRIALTTLLGALLLPTAASAQTCPSLNPAGFGPCDLVLGYGWTGSSCETISGCSAIDEFGVDQSMWLFPDHAQCTAVCTGAFALMQPTPATAGVVNSIAAVGATPGGKVWVAAGLGSGSIPVPGCPGVTLDLGTLYAYGPETAGPGGNAVFSAPVPAAAYGQLVRFQALDEDTCTPSSAVQAWFY